MKKLFRIRRIALANDSSVSGLKSQLIGWLAAQGEVLSNDSADHLVTTAVQRIAAKGLALGNEKTTLETRVTALANEKTALANQVTALTNERDQARKERAAYVVDLAIQKGILAVADREARITALGNAADFKKDADALLAEAVKHKVAGTIPGEQGDRKAVANASLKNPRDLLLGMVKKRQADTKESYKDAYNAIANENPALIEAMRSAAPQRS